MKLKQILWLIGSLLIILTNEQRINKLGNFNSVVGFHDKKLLEKLYIS